MTNIEPGNEMLKFKHRGEVVEVHQDFAYVAQELSAALTRLGFNTTESRLNWVLLHLDAKRRAEVTHVIELTEDELLNAYEEASVIVDNRFPNG